MVNCSINIWDGSKLELAWSKKSSSYFENNFPIFLLSCISNTSNFQVHDVLHWVSFLVKKTFSNIFRSTFCWGREYLNIFYIPFIFYLFLTCFIYIKSLFITITIKWCLMLMMRILFSFLLKLNSHHTYTFTSPLQQTLKQNHHALHDCYSVKNMLKLLAFIWLLNELLLEREWSEVMLI